MSESENALVPVGLVGDAPGEDAGGEDVRPWHGSDRPMDALYDSVMAEIAELRDRLSGKKDAPAEVKAASVADTAAAV
jgi:hypothetical protein